MRNSLLKNNAVLAQLKTQIRASAPKVEGKVKGTDKSFGFLEADDGQSYFIAPPEMRRLLPGDKVSGLVHSQTDAKGVEKQNFEPEELLEAGVDYFIGRVVLQGKKLSVQPEMHGFNQPLAAKLSSSLSSEGLSLENLSTDDWVAAKLVRHAMALDKPNFLVEITRLVAKAEDPAAPWQVVLARHQLPEAQPEFAQTWEFTEPEGLERQDLTQVNFFTLDNHSTQDMDDALAVEALENGGWKLQVAIADPAAYVLPASLADLEAKKRAFTLYMPARTITMLPQQLSDNLCSLRPQEKRPALVVSINLDATGAVVAEPEFCAAWIESKAKLDYAEVAQWLEASSGKEASSDSESSNKSSNNSWQPANPDLATSLQNLAKLAQARSNWRAENAVQGQDFVDYQFVLNAEQEVVDICVEERLLSHKMVEEAMLLANLSAAQVLAQQNLPAVFNQHTGFSDDKQAKLEELLTENLPAALELVASDADATETADSDSKNNSPRLEKFNQLETYRKLRQLIAAQHNPWLEARLRQLQNYAELSTQPAEHLSLGFPCYATFTSPLRRYGDLLNLRSLKNWLAAKPKAATAELDENLILELGQARKQNRQAEREVKDWLYARFLAPKVGQKFNAEIFNVNRGGLRVRLLANGASLFVPASSLHANRDEIAIDVENGWILIQDQKAYQLGDQLDVELSQVDIDKANLVGKV